MARRQKHSRGGGSRGYTNRRGGTKAAVKRLIEWTDGRLSDTRRAGGGVAYYLRIENAEVVGGGDVVFLGVKEALLVVQQLRQHSADRLLVPKVLSFCRQAANTRREKSVSYPLYTASQRRFNHNDH
ncbi:hypothetical protein EYF80_013852 [Liparis tanakae]|uniref:Uncharacterized protein n=1 Tax=Liparis tanakae TaxID=230148 RepID=A0A4Z2IEY1_9TELE|nr:hypothetical protein EYF80_013852 [Liparis tanakae]